MATSRYSDPRGDNHHLLQAEEQPVRIRPYEEEGDDGGSIRAIQDDQGLDDGRERTVCPSRVFGEYSA